MIRRPPRSTPFPTRRSSDLVPIGNPRCEVAGIGLDDVAAGGGEEGLHLQSVGLRARSEEHTSELQSRGHLVCRLLLEKKKKEIQRDEHSIINEAQKTVSREC